MSLLIKNASFIVTPFKVVKDKSIYIENGEIVEFETQEADIVIDARGMVALPGLINLHTHIPMTFLRGIAEDKGLEEWLNEEIWPREKKLNEKVVYYSSLLGIAESLRFGTTSFVDMYFFEEKVAEAAEKLGARAWVGEGIFDFFEKEKTEEEIKRAERVLKRVKKMKNELINPTIAPHSVYTCSKELLQVCSEIAREKGIPLHIHISETKEEVEEARKKFGMTPLLYLSSFKFFERNRVIGAHGIWLSARELVLARKFNLTIAHCPISNLKLGSGIAPIGKYLKRGIKVGLGTDGPASNNSLDMFEEMKVAALLQKLSDVRFPTLEVIKMATVYGARALGFKGGVIEENRPADIILVDLKKPHFMPIIKKEQVVNNLVYCAKGEDVAYTIVNGEIVCRGSVENLEKIESKVLEEVKKAGIVYE